MCVGMCVRENVVSDEGVGFGLWCFCVRVYVCVCIYVGVCVYVCVCA